MVNFWFPISPFSFGGWGSCYLLLCYNFWTCMSSVFTLRFGVYSCLLLAFHSFPPKKWEECTSFWFIHSIVICCTCLKLLIMWFLSKNHSIRVFNLLITMLVILFILILLIYINFCCLCWERIQESSKLNAKTWFYINYHIVCIKLLFLFTCITIAVETSLQNLFWWLVISNHQYFPLNLSNMLD